MTETIVVGAGVAGLVVARELVLRGHAVRVLEAADHPGGQLAPVQISGLRLDAGPESFSITGSLMRDYLARIGLADRLVTPAESRTWLHSASGSTAPLPAVSLQGIPASPLADDVVRVVGRRAAWRGLLDALLPGPVGSRESTLGALVRRRMGDGILERLVAPVVEATHGRHPDALAVSAVPGLVHHLLRENSLGRAVARLQLEQAEVPTQAGLDGGMATLIDALVAELDRYGVAIEYGVRVAEVHPDHVVLDAPPAGVDDADSDVQGDDDDIDRRPVRHGLVVVAAPGLLGRSGAHESIAQHLVILMVDDDHAPANGSQALGQAPRGARVVVARGAAVRARELVHSTAVWPWLRHMAGGREVLRLRYEQPASAEQARLDAEVLLGVSIPNDRVVAAETMHWMRAGRIDPAGEIAVVGEQVAGADLSAVIANAIETAERIGAPSS